MTDASSSDDTPTGGNGFTPAPGWIPKNPYSPAGAERAVDAVDADPDHLASLDDANRAMHQPGASEDMAQRFWSLVVTLPSWHFIGGVADAQKAAAEGRSPLPRFFNSPNGPAVFIYSTAAHMKDAMEQRMQQEKAKGVQSDDAQHGYVDMRQRMPDALAFACSFTVPMVAFDAHFKGGFGYMTQLGALPGLYRFHTGNPIPRACYGAIVRTVTATPHPALFMDAYSVLLSAPALFAVQSDDNKLAMTEHEGKAFGNIYTEQSKAEKVASENPGTRAVMIPPRELVSVHKGLESGMGERYAMLVVDPDDTPCPVHMPLFERAMKGLPTATDAPKG